MLIVAAVGVCEDDPDLRSVIVRALKGAGHEVAVARTGHEAVEVFPGRSLDVLVLDIGLPDSDGRDVAVALRTHGVTASLLFLTARSGLHDKVAGFEAGADDYLTKPFELAELMARVNALSRRITADQVVGAAVLDPAAHLLRVGDVEVSLSPTEFRLLAKLMANPGQAVRRRDLIASAWPMGAIVTDNTLDAFIRRLRLKLGKTSALDAAITTVRGVGYAWR